MRKKWKDRKVIMNTFLNSSGKQSENGFSKAVCLGDFVYVSAMNGYGETIEEQTITACNRILEAIGDWGLRMDHMVKFTVFLKDISLKQKFIESFKYFLEEPFPAVSIVEVSNLDDNSLVSIEAYGINTLRYEKQASHSCSSNCSSCNGGCNN